MKLEWLKEKILSELKGELRTKFCIWLENYRGRIEDILMEFKDIDSEKYEFIFTDENNTVIDSFAGTGTTRMLFLRAVYLLSKGIPPENILIILPSYNLINIWKEKLKLFELPAAEIKKAEDFLFELLERKTDGKKNIELVGRGEGFRYSYLVDRALPENADKFYLKKFILFKKAGQVIFEEEKYIDSYREYQIFLESNRFFDLGDLINLSFSLLSEPRFEYKNYQHILIDTYQEYPFKFFKILSFIGENVFMVGDRMKFPPAQIEFNGTLKNNYRFSRGLSKILEVITGKEIHTKSRNSFLRNIFYQAKDEVEGAKFVSFQIKYLKEKDNIDYNDIAVIFRDIRDFNTHFDESFKKNGIPFILYEEMEILRELKDAEFHNTSEDFNTLLEMAKKKNFSRRLTDWISVYEKNFPVSLGFKERIERINITKEKLILREKGVKILEIGDLNGFEFKVVIIPQFEEDFYGKEDKFLLYRALSLSTSGIYLISLARRKFKWYNVKKKVSPLIKDIFSFLEKGSYENFISRILKWIG